MFSELNDPARQPSVYARYDPSRDHRQDSRPEWIRFSFSVGLSHPLQCAGLSRRSLSPSVSGMVVSVNFNSTKTESRLRKLKGSDFPYRTGADGHRWWKDCPCRMDQPLDNIESGHHAVIFMFQIVTMD
jgi:hypothetical protein